jgi:hypothetical protein
MYRQRVLSAFQVLGLDHLEGCPVIYANARFARMPQHHVVKVGSAQNPIALYSCIDEGKTSKISSVSKVGLEQHPSRLLMRAASRQEKTTKPVIQKVIHPVIEMVNHLS